MLKKLMCVMLATACLQACAVHHVPQSVQNGKWSFGKGNFRLSFTQLLPAAADGYADAEYAIGYMYYYGYGVARDQDAGIFWMRRAARQGQGRAIKALTMIDA
jgi:TPR repeat protein